MRVISDNDLISAGRRLGRRNSLQQRIAKALVCQTAEIYLDIDGVLANFVDHLLNYLDLPKHPVTEYDDARITLNFYKVQEDMDFWLTMPPLITEIPGPVHAYVSARPELLRLPTTAWLEMQEGFPEAPVFVGQDHKHALLMPGGFMLDDNAETVEKLRQHKVNAYLLDQPWNRHVKTPYRVDSIEAFYKLTNT